MMEELRNSHKRYFQLSFIIILIFTGIIIMMPVVVEMRLEGNEWALPVLGIAFWIVGLSEVVVFFLMYRLRKQLCSLKKQDRKHELPGMFCFFRNPIAKVFDCLLGIGIIGFIVFRFYDKSNDVLFLAISILLLLLFIHAMLNGENYRLIKCDKQTTS